MHSTSTTVFDIESLSDKEATKVLEANRIALSPHEAKHFQKEIGRPLTLTELTILSIQGSEHCSYRSSRQHLKGLPTKGKYVILGPGEDAGIVEIAEEKNGRKWGLVIGHESHNHPSQIVPFEGAATGVGGCVRDIICMGAHVLGSLDLLRMGNPAKSLQRGIFREVVRGIAGYGNPLGIANLGGDIEFDSSFDTNCLVNVVAVGVVASDRIIHSFVPDEAARIGYDIILIGKPTDRSGFGGASFSSFELDITDEENNRGAVQEPNPFLERHILAATDALFQELAEKKILHRISCKDLGAGGVVCASVEQVAPKGYGASIELDKVPLAEDIPPHIVACSETQERLCIICHPTITPLILEHYNTEWDLPGVSRGASAARIGTVTSGNYILTWHGETIVDAPAHILTEGLRYDRPHKAAKKQKIAKSNDIFAGTNPMTLVKKLIGRPNIASRLCITEKYDKNVQGQTLLDGDKGAGAIFTPLTHTDATESTRGTRVTIGCGGDGVLGTLSAELQGKQAVCEAIANVVQVGATPRALTDCLNYGNPEYPEHMQTLLDGIAGLADAAQSFRTPFVSGNVSLYNYSGNQSVSPSAIVAAVGVLPEGQDTIPQHVDRSGLTLYTVGTRASRLGGSEVANLLKAEDSAYILDSETFAKESAFVLAAMKKGYITACRDIHRGGIAIAALEIALHGSSGVALLAMPPTKLFAENPGYVIAVTEKAEEKIAALAKKGGVTLTKLGETIAEPVLRIGKDTAPLALLRRTYEQGLRQILVP